MTRLRILLRVRLRSIGALSLLFAAFAVAARHPLATVEPTAACHDSPQAAAEAGLLAAAAKSRRVEYGGAVFQRDARCFVHSIPVTSNLPSQLEYRVQAAHRNMLLVGIYHTHTPGRYAHLFSERDAAVQRQLGVASWLGTLDSGSRHLTVRSLQGTAHSQIVSIVLLNEAQR